MEVLNLYLELITCEKERSLQLREIYNLIRNLKPRYLDLFEKYDRDTPCLEYCEILKIFVLYYTHIYEIYELVKNKKIRNDTIFTDRGEFRSICCSILTESFPISSNRLYVLIEYLNIMLTENVTFDMIGRYSREISEGNTIYVPGCSLIRVSDIVCGIMSDTRYSFVFFDDCFAKYKPHGGSLSVSYSEHDIDHHIVVNSLIDRNFELYIKIRDIYRSYLNKKGLFVFRCLEIIIFMYYHEFLPKFNDVDIFTNSFIHQEILQGEVDDIQQLLKYMIKAPDVELDFRAYILDRFDEQITESGDIHDGESENYLSEFGKYEYLSAKIMEKFKEKDYNLWDRLTDYLK